MTVTYRRPQPDQAPNTPQKVWMCSISHSITAAPPFSLINIRDSYLSNCKDCVDIYVDCSWFLRSVRLFNGFAEYPGDSFTKFFACAMSAVGLRRASTPPNSPSSAQYA